MNPSLQAKVIVVTGGAGRLGRQFCTMIAAEGGVAVVNDIDAPAAERLAVSLRERFGPAAAEASVFDICQAQQIDRGVDEIHRRRGRIDALVNNAYPRNARYGALTEDVTFEDFAENVSRHVGGYFVTAQRFIRYFSRQGHGNIINLGSIYGTAAPRFEIYDNTPMTMPVEYAVAKAGVLQLTRYLAQYYKSAAIRVNALSPGGIEAGQPASFQSAYSRHSLGSRMLQEGDVTGALRFLLADESRSMTGQNLVVDGGWTL